MKRAVISLAILIILGAGLSVLYWESAGAEPAYEGVAADPVLFEPTRADMETGTEDAIDLPADAG